MKVDVASGNGYVDSLARLPKPKPSVDGAFRRPQGGDRLPSVPNVLEVGFDQHSRDAATSVARQYRHEGRAPAGDAASGNGQLETEGSCRSHHLSVGERTPSPLQLEDAMKAGALLLVSLGSEHERHCVDDRFELRFFDSPHHHTGGSTGSAGHAPRAIRTASRAALKEATAASKLERAARRMSPVSVERIPARTSLAAWKASPAAAARMAWSAAAAGGGTRAASESAS